MSRIIKTYDDMCEERERLKNLLVVQKQRVVEDWNGVKNEFTPVKNVFGTIGKMTKGDKSNPMMNVGLKFASDLFLKHFVLAKAGWITKLAVPFVVRNYSSHLLADKGRGFFSRLGMALKGKKPARPLTSVPSMPSVPVTPSTTINEPSRMSGPTHFSPNLT